MRPNEARSVRGIRAHRHATAARSIDVQSAAGILVELDPARCRWRSINGTIGVHEILTNGDVPLAVPETIIAEIKSREDETGTVKLAPPSFRRGQAVRLTEGPLAELSGMFEEMRDENRIVLLVSLLGRKVRMQVNAAAVAAA